VEEESITYTKPLAIIENDPIRNMKPGDIDGRQQIQDDISVTFTYLGDRPQ
jgi:hypothetical protein